MTTEIDAVRDQRLRLLHALIEAWLKQPSGQHTDFEVTEKGDSYAIRHPELGTAEEDFHVARSDIDAMVKTGYLSIEPRDEPGSSILRIPYRGFDVFDASLGERARPEFERRVVFDIEGDRVEAAERTVVLHGHVYTVVATPRQGTGDWVARVNRYSLTSGALAFRRPILDNRSEIHDQVAILNTMRATSSTADAALADLEAQLHVAVERALRDEGASGPNGSHEDEGRS